MLRKGKPIERKEITKYYTLSARKGNFKVSFDGQINMIKSFRIVQASVVNPFIRIHPGNSILPMMFSTYLNTGDITTGFAGDAAKQDAFDGTNFSLKSAMLRIPCRDYHIKELIQEINTGINSLLNDTNFELKSSTANLTAENEFRNNSWNGSYAHETLTNMNDQLYLDYNEENSRITIVNKLFRSNLIIPGFNELKEYFLSNSTVRFSVGSLWPTLGFPHNDKTAGGYNALQTGSTNVLATDYTTYIPSVINVAEGNVLSSTNNPPLISGRIQAPQSGTYTSNALEMNGIYTVNLTSESVQTSTGTEFKDSVVVFANWALDTTIIPLSGGSPVYAVLSRASYPVQNPNEVYSRNFYCRDERAAYGVCETTSDSPYNCLYLKMKNMDGHFYVAKTEFEVKQSTQRVLVRQGFNNTVWQEQITKELVPTQSSISGIICRISLSAPGYMSNNFVSSVVHASYYKIPSKRELDLQIIDENGEEVDLRGLNLNVVIEAKTALEE